MLRQIVWTIRRVLGQREVCAGCRRLEVQVARIFDGEPRPFGLCGNCLHDAAALVQSSGPPWLLPPARPKPASPLESCGFCRLDPKTRGGAMHLLDGVICRSCVERYYREVSHEPNGAAT